MLQRKLKLVTLDVVNTMIRVVDSPGHQYALVANKNGINIQASDIDRIYRDVWRQKKSEHPSYGIHHNIKPVQWWDDFVQRVFIKAGYQGDKKLLADVSFKVWKHYNDNAAQCWSILPHSKEVLGEIKSKGYKLGVISNFDERLSYTLKELELEKYFDFTVTTITANCAKPGKAIFEMALKLGEVEPHESLHIGDDVKEDYFAARNVGMHAIVFDNKRKTMNAAEIKDFDIPKEDIITDINQVLDILPKLE